MIEPVKGMCLMKDKKEKRRLCAVSGLNLNRMGLIKCLYIILLLNHDKYSKRLYFLKGTIIKQYDDFLYIPLFFNDFSNAI